MHPKQKRNIIRYLTKGKCENEKEVVEKLNQLPAQKILYYLKKRENENN